MNWLLLRGLVREQRHWGTFPQLLEEGLLGHKSFCLDFPGVGTEHRRASPPSMRGLVEDLRPRWRALKVANPGPWSLFGISLGGMAAMEWVRAYPEDFSHLVVLNSSAANLSLPHTRLRWQTWQKLLSTAALTDPIARERGIISMTTNLQSDRDQLAQAWARYALEAPVSKETLVMQLFAAIRYGAPDKIRVPTLVLTSKADRFTDSSCSVKLADRFGAPISVHESAGHDISIDDPKWVAAQIRETFFKQ